jgi:hypothetical protein
MSQGPQPELLPELCDKWFRSLPVPGIGTCTSPCAVKYGHPLLTDSSDSSDPPVGSAAVESATPKAGKATARPEVTTQRAPGRISEAEAIAIENARLRDTIDHRARCRRQEATIKDLRSHLEGTLQELADLQEQFQRLEERHRDALTERDRLAMRATTLDSAYESGRFQGRKEGLKDGISIGAESERIEQQARQQKRNEYFASRRVKARLEKQG